MAAEQALESGADSVPKSPHGKALLCGRAAQAAHVSARAIVKDSNGRYF